MTKKKSKKEKIPAAVRNTVWLHYIEDKNNARCHCCKLEKITSANWHCGHVQSEKNGGKVHINNLRPICAGCNSSMGTMNMLEFMKKYGFDTINVSSIIPISIPIPIAQPVEPVLKTKKKVYNCTYCDKIFKSGAALGGHSIHCKNKTNYKNNWQDAILEVASDHKKRNYKKYFKEIKERKLYPITSEGEDLKIIKKTLGVMLRSISPALLAQDRTKSPYRYWCETYEEKKEQKKIEKYYNKECVALDKKIKLLIKKLKIKMKKVNKMKEDYDEKFGTPTESYLVDRGDSNIFSILWRWNHLYTEIHFSEDDTESDEEEEEQLEEY